MEKKYVSVPCKGVASRSESVDVVTVECVNMRPRSRGRGMERVGELREVDCVEAGARIVGALPNAANDTAESVTVGADMMLRVGGRKAGAVDDMPLSVNSLTDNTAVLIMPSAPPLLLRRDGPGWRLKEEPRPPHLWLRATAGGTVTATIEGRRLKGEYSRRSLSWTERDLSDLAGEMSAAVDTALERAHRQGREAGAVIARWRAVAADGTTVAESTPTLLVAGDDETTLCADVTITAEDDTYPDLEAFALRLPVMGLELVATTGVDTAAVSCVEVLMTPTLLPWDPAGTCDGRLTGFTNRECVGMLSLPGTGFGDYRTLMRRRVAGALERLDKLERVVGRIDASELERAGSIVSLNPAGAVRPSASAKAVTGVLAGEASGRLMGGTAFAAGSVGAVGSTVVWGNIVDLPTEAPSPAHLTAGTGDSATWRGYCSVSDAGTGGIAGRRVASVQAAGPVPESLSPLVAVKGERATGLTVAVARGDSVASATVGLRPLAGTGWSYFLTDDLMPIALEAATGAYREPAALTMGEAHPGTVIVAGSDDPLRGVQRVEVSPGAIAAVTPMPRGNTGLEPGRSAHCVLTSAGIYQLTVSRKGDTAGVRLLDCRAVESERMAAMSRDSLYAVASGRLLRVQGSRVTDLCGVDGDARAVGDCASRGETWVSGSRTTIHSEGREYERTDVEVERFCHAGGRMYVVTTDGRLLLADREERGAGSIEVKWRCSVSGLRRPLRSMLMTMRATGMKGTLKVTTPARELVTAYDIAGDISEPVGMRIVMPWRPTVEVELAGTAEEMRIEALNVEC